ncbi:unnamed protein product [Calypogeia fissa]
MAAGSARFSGIHHDLPRSSPSSLGGPGWIPAGLQKLLLAVVGLFLIPSILFAFVNVNDSSTTSGVLSHNDHHDSATGLRHPSQTVQSATSLSTPTTNLPELIPKYENVDGTEYVWQIPTAPKPKAVLFLAHGCQCRSTFFWDRHPQCLNCTGMPEERTLVLDALARGYSVIAVSSTGQCWSSQVDTKKVLKVLRNWVSDLGLVGLPVFGLGASSGGYFISVLAMHFKFQSLIIEISSGRFEAMDFDSTYPPTLFVHMPRDKGLAERISEARDLLSEKGVHNDELLCSPLEITDHFFSERIPDVSRELSEKIVASLHQYGILVPAHKGLYMKADGRQSGWKTALRKESVLSDDDFVKWERHLQEEMNLAYAYHEFTSLPSQYIFDWFDSSAPNVDNS